MITKKRKLVIEAIDNAVFFALYFGVFIAVVAATSSYAFDLARAGFMVLPAICYFYFRRVFTNYGTLFVMHLIVPALFAIIGVGFVWVLMALVLAGHSLLYMVRKEPRDTTGFIALATTLFIILSLWAAYMAHWQLLAVYPGLFLAAAVGRLVIMHMVQMDKSLEAILESSPQPVDAIIKFDYKLVAGLAVVMICIAAVLYFLIFAPILGAAWGIVPGLPPLDQRPPQEELIRELIDPDTIFPDAPPRDQYTAMSPLFRFLDVFFRILATVATFFILAFLLFVIARAIVRFLSRRSRGDNSPDALRGIQEEREFILPQIKRRKRARTVFADEHPVRRRFREKVQNHMKMGVPIKKSDTPTDMTKRIQSEDISDLAEAYAPVRYNNKD